MKYQNLATGIRQTYIIMFEENGMRYIFNRSIPWDSILSTKNIAKLIDVLGKDAIDNFIVRLNKTENNLCTNINELSKSFILDNTVFSILEIHPEWKNTNRKDQWDKIEPCKDALCIKYNAVKRKDKLANTIEIDKQIGSILKYEFKKWLRDIYDAIIEYSNFVQDGIVHTALGTTIETLKQQIASLEREKTRLNEDIKYLNEETIKNKKTLRKQNYVIDAYNRYINNLSDNDIQKLRETILRNNKYYEKSYCF